MSSNKDIVKGKRALSPAQMQEEEDAAVAAAIAATAAAATAATAAKRVRVTAGVKEAQHRLNHSDGGAKEGKNQFG